MVDGRWPDAVSGDAVVEVVLPEATAETYELEVGTEYLTYDLRSPLGGPITIPVRLVGLWQHA